MTKALQRARQDVKEKTAMVRKLAKAKLAAMQAAQAAGRAAHAADAELGLALEVLADADRHLSALRLDTLRS